MYLLCGAALLRQFKLCCIVWGTQSLDRAYWITDDTWCVDVLIHEEKVQEEPYISDSKHCQMAKL